MGDSIPDKLRGGERITFEPNDIVTLEMYGWEIHDLDSWIRSRLKNRESAIASKLKKHKEAQAEGKKIAVRKPRTYKKYPEIRIVNITKPPKFLNTGKTINITSGLTLAELDREGDTLSEEAGDVKREVEH